MKIYKKTEHPEKIKGEVFSVDVITCDEDGLPNLGFYNYDTDTWSFHTDTLSDYSNVNFVWMYIPTSKMINCIKKQ